MCSYVHNNTSKVSSGRWILTCYFLESHQPESGNWYTSLVYGGNELWDARRERWRCNCRRFVTRAVLIHACYFSFHNATKHFRGDISSRRGNDSRWEIRWDGDVKRYDTGRRRPWKRHLKTRICTIVFRNAGYSQKSSVKSLETPVIRETF